MSDVPTIPTCPRCGSAMELHRILPASFGYPELRTFACTQCREAVTVEVVPAPTAPVAPVQDGQAA